MTISDEQDERVRGRIRLKNLIIFLCLIASGFIASELVAPEYRLRHRLLVEFDIDGKDQYATSVFEKRVRWSLLSPSENFKAFTNTEFGESPTLDLGSAGALLLLLSCEHRRCVYLPNLAEKAFALAEPLPANSLDAPTVKFESFPKIEGERTIPLTWLPPFIYVKEPKREAEFERLKPEELETYFKGRVRLTRIVDQITNDPVEFTLDTKFPGLMSKLRAKANTAARIPFELEYWMLTTKR